MKTVLFVLYIITILFAGELIYTPKSPGLGGNGFNSQWVMSEAQAQNEFTAPKENIFDRDPIKEFEESLNRQLLSRISREIIAASFGESSDSFKEGTYQIGDYTIEVSPDLANISIVITDGANGNTTTIEVPYYETGGLE